MKPSRSPAAPMTSQVKGASLQDDHGFRDSEKEVWLSLLPN